MDRYADSMIARGPTLTADRATATGSMWEFEGDEVANARFLVIGHGKSDTSAVGSARSAAQRRYFADGGYLEQMIACGPLLSDPSGALRARRGTRPGSSAGVDNERPANRSPRASLIWRRVGASP